MSFAFVTGFVTKFCGLHCTVPTNTRQSQWETVISCAGGQVFLVRLGGASAAMRAVPVAAGCSMKEGLSISVFFWLRMPWSRGCWLSVTKRSVLCTLGSVHPGERVWMRHSRSSLRGYCLGLLSLGSSQPSTGSVWWRSGPWVDPGLLAWTYHCIRLGDWSLDLASSSVAFP